MVVIHQKNLPSLTEVIKSELLSPPACAESLLHCERRLYLQLSRRFPDANRKFLDEVCIHELVMNL